MDGRPTAARRRGTRGTLLPRERSHETTNDDQRDSPELVRPSHDHYVDDWDATCHGFEHGIDWCRDPATWDPAMTARAAALRAASNPAAAKVSAAGETPEIVVDDPIDSGLAAVRFEGVFGRRPGA
jgi:hypothetical protein